MNTTVSIMEKSGVQTVWGSQIRVVDHIPLGRHLLTQEGYVLYSTENEQYLSYDEFSNLCWREEPINLFLSEDINDGMILLMPHYVIQLFIGEETYASCILVPSVYYSRPIDAPTIDDKPSIIEVHLVQNFRRAFPWSDIASWQS